MFQMSKKITPLQIEKYDITNRMFNNFADLESRHILFSIIKEQKNIAQISEELCIPLSSVYKKISTLLDSSLVQETKRELAPNGKIIRYYQSKIKDISIKISKFEPVITFKKNPGIKNELG